MLVVAVINVMLVVAVIVSVSCWCALCTQGGCRSKQGRKCPRGRSLSRMQQTDKCRQMSQTNADKRFCICRQMQTHITDKCRQMHDKCSKPEAEIQQDGICQACWFGECCMHVLAVVLDSTICGVCCAWVCTTVKQQEIKRKTEKTLEKSECLL